MPPLLNRRKISPVFACNASMSFPDSSGPPNGGVVEPTNHTPLATVTAPGGPLRAKGFAYAGD